MSFRALVADDEYMIRRGIISFLNKYDDFEVAAEAEDGEMALELALERPIDVYFVDINMPFLNGLAFIEKIKDIHPKALIVVITGYDRFEYAREALKLGTFEYLLKPLMEDTFDSMIQRLRKRLEEENNENKYLEWAKSMLIQNRENLVGNFLQKALEGHFTNEEIEERAAYLAIEIPEDFTITVVQLEYQETADVQKCWNDDLLFFVARNVGNEIFNDLHNIDSCQDAYGNLVVVSKSMGPEESKRLAGSYKRALEEYIPVKVAIVQEDGAGYEHLPDAYQRAAARLGELQGISATIKMVKEYVEKNFAKEVFSLQDAAEYVNLSVQHLSRLFKKEMGVTFIDYLTSVRIRKSIELFQDEELKIYEIAEKIGYSTQHYFSNVFKKHLGVSPAEYRKLQKKY